MKDELHSLIDNIARHQCASIRQLADPIKSAPRFVVNFNHLRDAIGTSEDRSAAIELIIEESISRDELHLPFDQFVLMTAVPVKGDDGRYAFMVTKEGVKLRIDAFGFEATRSGAYRFASLFDLYNFESEMFYHCPDDIGLKSVEEMRAINFSEQVRTRFNEDFGANRSFFVRMAYDLVLFLFALRMAYAHVEKMPGIDEKNKRRARMNRPPLPVQHVVAIDIGKMTKIVRELGGTHASPTGHLRRAHLRRLLNGRVVEVRASKIKGGPASVPTYTLQ